MDGPPDPGQPTALVLPADSRIPSARADATSDAENEPWNRNWVTPKIEIRDERERNAWLHFCRGHHAEFIYWQVSNEVALAAGGAAAGGDERDLERQVQRLCALVRGSGAMLGYTAAFDPGTYDPCLRPSMAAERDDFSGDMSRDFLAMARAKAELMKRLEDAGLNGPLDRLRRAERRWVELHGEVVQRLHPGSSLLKEKMDALSDSDGNFDFSVYVETVVHGPQALDDYDEYFGVERSTAMTLDAYWTQALEKFAAVHRSFALEPSARAELMRGDATVLAVLSELLEAA